MQNATEVYGRQVRQMPPAERLRLAALILDDLSAEQNEGGNPAKTFSALQLLERRTGGGVFKTAEEADEHLKAERESWDK